DPTTMFYIDTPITSTYMALCLAVHMGASRIGLIGVDFTDHLFSHSGMHILSHSLREIDERYWRLGEALIDRGIKVFNLSLDSRLTAFPKISLQDFSALPVPPALSSEEYHPLRIVSYSVTPLVGVPAILANCINVCTPHSCRCLLKSSGYGNGLVFAEDI